MSYDVELPKWPLLMVRGRNIRPEQADLVIIRTSWIGGGVHCNERKWTKKVCRAFGVTADPYSSESWGQWERVAEELGVLDVQYIHNDRIATYSASGPRGWVSWGGQVFCRGMTLLSKWPTVEDVTDDWRKIAHAFPFLDLTAQLVAEELDESFERVESYRPLVAWRVANGAAEVSSDPGEPLFSPTGDTRTEELDRLYAKGFPPEWGVREKRLRAAVRRCRRRTARGI